MNPFKLLHGRAELGACPQFQNHYNPNFKRHPRLNHLTLSRTPNCTHDRSTAPAHLLHRNTILHAEQRLHIFPHTHNSNFHTHGPHFHTRPSFNTRPSFQHMALISTHGPHFHTRPSFLHTALISTHGPHFHTHTALDPNLNPRFLVVMFQNNQLFRIFLL